MEANDMRKLSRNACHERRVQVIVSVVDSSEPPHRLSPGADTVARIARKHQEVDDEVARWRSLAMSTGFVPAVSAWGAGSLTRAMIVHVNRERTRE
jgi:hypothetical protein